jgi:hypothetical protein
MNKQYILTQYTNFPISPHPHQHLSFVFDTGHPNMCEVISLYSYTVKKVYLMLPQQNQSIQKKVQETDILW